MNASLFRCKKRTHWLFATYPGKGQRKDDRSEALNNFQ